MFDPFLLPKMSVEFDTSLHFVFFVVKKVLTKSFSETHNIDVLLPKH